MDKTILVIGSVTAKQYQAARARLQRKGHKSKVVRLTRHQFFLSDSAFAPTIEDTYLDVEDERDMPIRDYLDLLEQNAREHLRQFGSIGAIVMDEEAWEDWDTGHCGTLIALLGDPTLDYLRWLVHADGIAQPLD